jgi:hypothetical protein
MHYYSPKMPHNPLANTPTDHHCRLLQLLALLLLCCSTQGKVHHFIIFNFCTKVYKFALLLFISPVL